MRIIYRSCYKALESILIGNNPDNMDEVAQCFFYDCFARLARKVKGNEYKEMQKFLANMKLNASCSNRNSLLDVESLMNPLNIPENIGDNTDELKLLYGEEDSDNDVVDLKFLEEIE